MNVDELLAAIDEAGGMLTLHPDRIVYRLPNGAAHLVDELKLHRRELEQVLTRRFALGVKNFLRERCVRRHGTWVTVAALRDEFQRVTEIGCDPRMFCQQVQRNGHKLVGEWFKNLGLRLEVNGGG